MGTTTKMAIPYPEATGLVKDGWEDMKDIATQVDAKSGLVLINTTTIGAVASQSVNDVFSANYEHYKILLRANYANNAVGVTLRFRVSGSDHTGANYASYQYLGGTSTNTAQTSFGGMAYSATAGQDSYNEVIIMSPFLTKPTHIATFGMTKFAANNLGGYAVLGGLDTSTSYTGFTLTPTSGNFSGGEVFVYGFND